jgi:predicted type IV restriction endonuclease
MAEKMLRARSGEEIWETTTAGRVWVTTTDHRGHERDVSVGGKIGARLRITTVDREINQDRVLEELSDPFRNGLLRRLDADQNVEERTTTDQALTTDDLVTVFAKHGSAFQAAVRNLNERNVRRLREMAEAVDATTSQVTFLDQHLEAKYRRHGAMPSYKDMMAANDE